MDSLREPEEINLCFSFPKALRKMLKVFPLVRIPKTLFSLNIKDLLKFSFKKDVWRVPWQSSGEVRIGTFTAVAQGSVPGQRTHKPCCAAKIKKKKNYFLIMKRMSTA